MRFKTLKIKFPTKKKYKCRVQTSLSHWESELGGLRVQEAVLAVLRRQPRSKTRSLTCI